MKILLIMFVVLVVMWAVDLARWIITRKETKKSHAEMLKAWTNLEKTINNDLVETKSAKRWMCEVLKQLEK